MSSTLRPEQIAQDAHWMRFALSLAKAAAVRGEVPVGAIVVAENRIVGTGINLRETLNQATAHAEILALQSASDWLKSWRLVSCALYVSLEPCIMCAGAIYQSRVSRLVYGAVDPKAGAIESLYQLNNDARLNHRYPVVQGPLADESSQLLKDFFRQRRCRSKTGEEVME